MKLACSLSVPGAKIISICTEVDKLIVEKTSKVYTKGKLLKGVAFPTSISLNDMLAHFSPSEADAESGTLLKAGDLIKMYDLIHFITMF